MIKRKVLWLAIGWIFILPPMSQATGIDRDLLERTVVAARANVFPSKDVKVIYEPMTEHLYISFTTPKDYKRSSGDSVWRWRSNQWSVLQEFMLSRIPVKFVSVETNDLEEERQLRYTHTHLHTDKYGDIRENRLWLKTATITEKRRGSESWEKIK